MQYFQERTLREVRWIQYNSKMGIQKYVVYSTVLILSCLLSFIYNRDSMSSKLQYASRPKLMFLIVLKTQISEIVSSSGRNIAFY